MGTYFVSADFGLDTNDGLSPGAAWATLAKANSELAAYNGLNGDQGHTVYIGPGTYREMIELGASGLDVDHCIEWVGDAVNRYGLASVAGRVRITRCGIDELPQAGVVISFNGKTWVRLRQLVVDGSSDNWGISGNNTTSQFIDNCYIQSFYGVSGIVVDDCISVSASPSYQSAVVTNSIAISGGAGFQGNTTATNCLAMGGLTAYIANSGQTLTATNCVAWGANQGFSQSSATSVIIATNSIALNCRYAVNASSSAINVSGIHFIQCGGNILSGSMLGSPIAGKAVLFDSQAIIRALMPVMGAGLKDIGTAVGLPLTDALGMLRVGTADIGPFQLSTVTVASGAGEYRTKPGIKITGVGQHLYARVPVKKGNVARVYGWMKCNVGNGDNPQMVLSGDCLASDVTVASTVGEGVWQDVFAEATAVGDGFIDVYMVSRKDSYSVFEDFRASVLDSSLFTARSGRCPSLLPVIYL
jgi:hypothetical protein